MDEKDLPPGAAARSRRVSPGGSRSGRACDPASCTAKWPAAKRGEEKGLPERTVSARGESGEGSVEMPSTRRAAARESRSVFRVFVRRSTPEGELSASRIWRVTDSPKRSSQRRIRNSGWEKRRASAVAPVAAPPPPPPPGGGGVARGGWR